MIKDFKCVLVVDYKSGKFKVYSKKPRDTKGTKIPINVSLQIEVPETPEINMKGKIKLSDEKVQELVMEEI